MNIRFIATALTALTAVLASSAFGQAPQPEGPFAVGACKTGCVVYDSRPSTIYAGAVAKSYRVCTADTIYSADLIVDKRQVNIASGACADVNGTTITLKFGKVLAGRLPE